MDIRKKRRSMKTVTSDRSIDEIIKEQNAKKRKQKVPEGYKAGYIGKPGQESKLIFVPDKGRPRKNMKKGGKVKKTKSHRGDGIAKRGRTKGRMV